MPVVNPGSTSYITTVYILDSTSTTGAGKTGLAYNTAGLTWYYKRSSGTASVAVTLASISTLGSYVSGGFKEIDSTNMPGLYEIDPPDAALATGATGVTLFLAGATGMVPVALQIDLNATVAANVTQWNGTNVAAPNVAGVPLVDVGYFKGTASAGAAGYSGVDWGAVTNKTTTNALTGTTISSTQAVASVSGSVGSVTGAVGSVTGNVGGNVTGSVGSISGVTFPSNFASFAIDASGRIDVGKILGTASAGSAGYVGLDWGHINAPTTTVGLTGTTISSGQVVGSVTGAVGSVTGSVGSVTGAVGSVTGAVGSVTGNVGGNVVGSVGSVTAIVTANVTEWSGTNVAGAIPPDVVFLHSGTAQAGGASTITLDSGASATNNLYQNQIVFIRSGAGAGQSAIITSYVGSTKVATIVGAWATNPDATSVFSILPFGSVTASISGGVNVTQWNGTNVAAPNIAGVPLVDLGYTKGTASAGAAGYVGIDWAHINAPTTTVDLTGTTISSSQVAASVTAGVTVGGYAAGEDPATLVLGATASSWDTAGTIGAAINAAGTAGDPWITALPGSYGPGTAGYIIGTYLNATVSSRSTYAGGAVASVTGSVGSVAGTVSIDLAQAVTPAASGTMTVGGCLNAAMAQAGGAWTWSGTTLTVLNTDASTFRTFTINATAPTSGAPTSRT